MSSAWKHGLFGCLDDITVCLLTYFIPCYVYGKTAEALDESCLAHALTFLFHPLAWYCMANTRARIREKRGIDGTWLNDCLITGFCALCALPQMYNEVVTGGMSSMARE